MTGLLVWGKGGRREGDHEGDEDHSGKGTPNKEVFLFTTPFSTLLNPGLKLPAK
jgi:hypothetical protein